MPLGTRGIVCRTHKEGSKKKKINGGPGLKLRRSCGALTNWLPLGEGARNQGRRRHLGGILIRLTNRDACFRCRQQIFFFFFFIFAGSLHVFRRFRRSRLCDWKRDNAQACRKRSLGCGRPGCSHLAKLSFLEVPTDESYKIQPYWSFLILFACILRFIFFFSFFFLVVLAASVSRNLMPVDASMKGAMRLARRE